MSFPSWVRKTRVLTLAIGVICAHSASAIEPTANVIEYYNASLNHFFVTAYADEAANARSGNHGQGVDANGPELERVGESRGQPDCDPGVPLFRNAWKGTELALLHRRRRRVRIGEEQSALDIEAIAFYMLARWFGVASADLSTVFTNVAKFSTSDLGFMS